MKILSLIRCKNHIDTLPYAVEHYQQIGAEVFVIDQDSSDGSIEWLQRRKIPYTRDDPTGLISEKKPDWILEVRADEFVIFPTSLLRSLVQTATEKGFNQIKCRQLNFYSTGEVGEKNHPKDRYYYYLEDSITKSILHQGDVEARPCLIEAFILNYRQARLGEVKPREELLDIRNLQAISHFFIV